jgi:hypothetical protein
MPAALKGAAPAATGSLLPDDQAPPPIRQRASSTWMTS